MVTGLISNAGPNMNWSETPRALGIGRELKRKRPHEGFAIVRNTPGSGIDVRHQTISQLIVLRKNVLDLWTVIPNLGIRLISVNAENRAERAVFKPANQQFVVCIRGVLIFRPKESADIGGPIRHAGHAEAQACGNLPSQCNPVRS